MKSTKTPVRYGVIGLGHIAQVAVLPAFAHASNSRLVALFSDDATKRRELSGRYKVPAYPYVGLDAVLAEGRLDALYIALPNSLHRLYAEKAARAGVHVLCEKPLAVTASDARHMSTTARQHRVQLMTAYRLHFEKANLTAVDWIRRGRIGNPRIFNSVFSHPVKPGDIRLQKKLGGGAMYDLGIYCINAARYLFQSEPTEVLSAHASSNDPRFREVPEMTSAILRFPGERLATLTASFGGSECGGYSVVGTKGQLTLDPAFDYVTPLTLQWTINEKSGERTYPRRDHFAPELIHFSQCIQQNRKPEPSGDEGAIDVAIIEAIYRSARERRSVRLTLPRDRSYPQMAQEIRRQAVRKPMLVKAVSSGGKD